ncbi:hypothetical protein N0V82_001570 [Gnomoniopsis sp. IMI 355080]|nr:hypothetical protein N0V82_001570 [Gnomoniopsis sp. IMI 355080]
MAVLSLALLLLFTLFDPLLALSVTPDSPCSSKCTSDGSESTTSNTVTADIVCDDSDFTSTTKGETWKECMSCLQNSTYTQGEESDQGWFLYNLRYSFDSCVFGYPNDTSSGSNPCETSTACGTLKTALVYDSLSSDSSESNEFGYCDADGGSFTGQYYQACLNCVTASGDSSYIANSLVALDAGCLQRPNTSDLLGLSDSVFSTSLVQIVDPSTLNNNDAAPALSTAAIAGIAAGGAAVLIIIAAIIFVRCRKRRNRANLGIKPRWGKDKRRSSFSFKCRNILASPLSPKFFTDLPPVEENHQPYGSLEEQMAGMSTINRAPDGRYYIETKPKYQTHPYETALDGRRTQDTLSSLQSTLVSEPWDDLHVAKKRGPANRSPMTIDTTEAGLSPPPAAHQSPKANEFGISPISTRLAPAINTSYTTPVNNAPATISPVQSFSRSSPKPKTTTMSSQGSGYPSRKSPETSSPLVQQHGWPSSRGTPEPWFPPPPPSGPSPSKYGRKVSLGAVGSTRKGKRESGSPVESKQVQVVFPGPPQR